MITSLSPLREVLAHYCSTVSILKKGFAQEKYRIEQISRSSLGQIIVSEVTSVDIATYRDTRLAQTNRITGKPISAATARLEMSLLSNMFDVGKIEWGVCQTNPVCNVRKPKSPPGRERRLTPREERLILRYANAHENPHLLPIIVLALETAMRQGEILNLRWEHINLKSRIAHLPETKNGSSRSIPLSIKARDTLIRLGVKSHGAAFSYTSNGLKSTWRLMLIRLGIEDLHFHDLRHEAISRLFELGTLDMMEISAISGHKSLSMLKRYTHLKAQRLVKKLEGNKHKGRQMILDALLPYPALFDSSAHGISVKLLDFNDLIAHGDNQSSAVANAQDALLRRILQSIRDGVRIPPPDQYLDSVEECKIVMIDPLACFHA